MRWYEKAFIAFCILWGIVAIVGTIISISIAAQQYYG